MARKRDPVADLARMHERARMQRLVLHNRAVRRWQARIERDRRRDEAWRDARLADKVLHAFKVCVTVAVVLAIYFVERCTTR